MILSTNKVQPQLFVCTQKRGAPNPVCCSNNGSQEILAALRSVATDNSLNLDILETGCMMLCEEGPNIRLNPIGKIWSRVSIQNIPEIIEACKKISITS